MNKFSIIIPMYNVEKYIKKCIESCLNQSYDNYEIIIVDDQSTDSSLSIAKKIFKNKKSIKIIEQQNSGVSVARNRGIEESSGDWLIFVDGDDWIEKNTLNKLNSIITNNNQNSDIIITSFYTNKGLSQYSDHFFKEENIKFENNMNIELIKNCICKTDISNEKSSTNLGVPWAKVYKKRFIDDNKLRFKPGLNRMQDMIFNISAFYFAKKVICVNISTYHYRINIGSITKKYNNNFDKTADIILEEINNFITKYKLEKELLDYYYAKTIKLFIEMIRVQYVPKENKIKSRVKIKEIKQKLEIKKIFYNNKITYLLTENEKKIYFLISHKFIGVVFYFYKIKQMLENKRMKRS